MAISDALPGVSVQITVNGEALKEYEQNNTTNNDACKTTKYIEATSRQVFEVLLKVHRRFKFKGDCIIFWIEADGALVDKPIILKDHGSRHRASQGRLVRADQVEKYTFGDVDIDDTVRKSISKDPTIKHLGSIVVHCTQKHATHRMDPKFINRTQSPRTLSEKDVKGRAVSHNVTLTGPQKCAAMTWWQTEKMAGEPDPAATFIFRYRSLAALKSMRIVPRTPSPEPLERRAAATLSTEEIEQLQKRVQTAQVKGEYKERIKHELRLENTHPRKRARPNVGDMQIEIDDDGNIHERIVTAVNGAERVFVELE